MPDFLGYESRIHEYMPFEEAKEYIRSLNLKSGAEYLKLWRENKLPNNLPAKPDRTYKEEGFISIPDFLGYESRFQQWMSFDAAKKFVHNLNLKSEAEWRKYIKTKNKPSNIPASPSITYKENWKNMGDWLGTNKIADNLRIYRSYSEAKK